MAIESISCQVRTARKQHQCELCLCPIHNGEDDWAGSMFSRVIKILNELNAYEYIDLGNYEI